MSVDKVLTRPVLLRPIGRLAEGAVVHAWKPALGALTSAYPDRLTGLT